MRPLNLPAFFFNIGTWKGRIKESGIWNHRMCVRGEGMGTGEWRCNISG